MVFIFLAYFTLYNGLQFHPSHSLQIKKKKKRNSIQNALAEKHSQALETTYYLRFK